MKDNFIIEFLGSSVEEEDLEPSEQSFTLEDNRSFIGDFSYEDYELKSSCEPKNDSEKDLELQKQYLENINLKKSLQEVENNLSELKDKIKDLARLNHKSLQDLEYEKIQTVNLRSINSRLELSLKNLKHNKDYIYKLVLKKRVASLKIGKLVKLVKYFQNIIKQKNVIISKISYHNNRLLEQTARAIHESYDI